MQCRFFLSLLWIGYFMKVPELVCIFLEGLITYSKNLKFNTNFHSLKSAYSAVKVPIWQACPATLSWGSDRPCIFSLSVRAAKKKEEKSSVGVGRAKSEEGAVILCACVKTASPTSKAKSRSYTVYN